MVTHWSHFFALLVNFVENERLAYARVLHAYSLSNIMFWCLAVDSWMGGTLYLYANSSPTSNEYVKHTMDGEC